MKVIRRLLFNDDHPANNESPKLCNCQDPELCLHEGSFLIKTVLYKVLVKVDGVIGKFPVGSTTTFKLRYRSHMCSLTRDKCTNSTTLLSHIKDMKCKRIVFSLQWSIISRSPTISTGIRN